MEILKSTELDKAAELLKKGEVIAFPTETVYGLGVVYDNKEAYDKLVKVKRRPPMKPFTLMLADVEDVEKYAELNDVAKALVKNFMPGQFTMITTAKPGLPKWCISEIGRVGIRIADYDLIRDLIRKTGKPLLVPSANKSGDKPALSSEEAEAIFGDEVDYYVFGKCESAIPSTIIDLTGNDIKIIREGELTYSEIQRRIKNGD